MTERVCSVCCERQAPGTRLMSSSSCGSGSSTSSAPSRFFPAASTPTTASGVSLADKLMELFGPDCFDVDLDLALVCQVCFDLLEELDVFEQNIIGTKIALEKRYTKKKKRASNSFDGPRAKRQRRERKDPSWDAVGEELTDLKPAEAIKIECKVEVEEDSLEQENEGNDRDWTATQHETGVSDGSRVDDDNDDGSHYGDDDGDSYCQRSRKKSSRVKAVRNRGSGSCSRQVKSRALRKPKSEMDDAEVVYGPVAPIDYDKFVLDLPSGAMPRLPIDVMDETKCTSCEASFQSLEEKVSHFLCHHTETPVFTCPTDKVQMHPDELPKHSADFHGFVHEVSENGQDVGQHSYVSKDELAELSGDVRVVGESGSLQCGLCGLICASALAFSYHRKVHHLKFGAIPIHCPFCTHEDGKERAFGFDELRHHVLKGHFNFTYRRKLPRLPNEVDPMSGESTIIKFGGVTKRLEDLHFKEHHEVLFYPEKTLEKMKDSDGVLENLPDKFKNLLLACLQALKKIPSRISTREERLQMDIIKLKCAIPQTKSYPKDAVCFDCNEDFDNFFRRVSHFLEHHEPEERFLLYCAICSKPLRPGKEAFRHMKVAHKQVFNNVQEDSSWRLGDTDEEGKIIVQQPEGCHYQCDICTLVCGSELSYWFHRRSEHRMSMLSSFDEQSCKACVVTKFENEWSFFHHMMNKHGGFQYQCPVCKKGYNKNFMLKDHFKVHATTGVVEIRHGSLQKLSGKRSGLYHTESTICDICSKTLKSVRMLAQHKSNFHGIDVPCNCRVPKCGILFQSFREESKHFRQVHQKFQTTCHICGKMLLGKGLLQKHIEQEHSDQSQKIVCTVCSKQLKTLQNLKNHMVIHDESHKGHDCSFCGKNFRWTTSLNSHIKAAHSVVFKSFECEECGKVFKDPANFKAHCYTHSSVKPYNCAKCGKGFVRKDTWLTHTSSCNALASR